MRPTGAMSGLIGYEPYHWVNNSLRKLSALALARGMSLSRL